MAETTDSMEVPLPDEITITGINARGHHGVLQSERDAGQEFTVDLTIGVFVGDAAAGDDLYQTVNYAHVAEAVVEVLEGPAVNLIETVAERIAAVILENHLVSHVKVTVHKPSAPIPVPFGSVEVTVNRSRSNPPRVQRPFVENGAPAVADLPSWSDVNIVGIEPEPEPESETEAEPVVEAEPVAEAEIEAAHESIPVTEPDSAHDPAFSSIEEPVASPVAMPVVAPFGAGVVAVAPVATPFEVSVTPDSDEPNQASAQVAESQFEHAAGLEQGTAVELGTEVEQGTDLEQDTDVEPQRDLETEPAPETETGVEAETELEPEPAPEAEIELASEADTNTIADDESAVNESQAEASAHTTMFSVVAPASSAFDLGNAPLEHTSTGQTLSELMGWTDDGPLDLSKPLFEQSTTEQLPPLPKPFFSPATPDEPNLDALQPTETDAPGDDEPATDEPVNDGLANDELANDEPVAEALTVEEPAWEQSAPVEVAAEAPAFDERINVDPVGIEPAAVEPVDAESAEVEPSDVEPIAVEPTDDEPTVVEPADIETFDDTHIHQEAPVAQPHVEEEPKPAPDVTLLMERITRQIGIALGETPATDEPEAQEQGAQSEQSQELSAESGEPVALDAQEPASISDFAAHFEEHAGEIADAAADVEAAPFAPEFAEPETAAPEAEEPQTAELESDSNIDPFNSSAVTQAIPVVGSSAFDDLARGGTAIFEPAPASSANSPYVASPHAASPHAISPDAATAQPHGADAGVYSSENNVFGTFDAMDEVPTEPVKVVLAIGANLGDAQGTLNAAVIALRSTEGVTVDTVGPLARTAAVGGVEQPDFLNSVVIGHTTLSPRQLLRVTQGIEQDHHRTREVHWGPRTLDVDIIVYGQKVGSTDDLELPHPRAKERAFVLVPWDHADPEATLPGLGGGPVSALAATAPDREGIRWLALDWLTK